jgi:hypothetical protein
MALVKGVAMALVEVGPCVPRTVLDVQLHRRHFPLQLEVADRRIGCVKRERRFLPHEWLLRAELDHD